MTGSDLLGLSSAALVQVERGAHDRQARNRGSLASSGIPAVLALEIELRQKERPATDQVGDS